MRYDVIIIGAGPAGIFTALELLRRGYTDGGKKKPIKIVTTEVYFPWWAWVLVGVGVLAVAGAVVLFVVLTKHKKAKQAQEA